MAIKQNQLDPSISLGGGGSTLTVDLSTFVGTLVAGENISANQPLGLALDGGVYKIYKSDADASDRNFTFIGFAEEAASIGSPVQICYKGPLAGFTGLTTGAVYYLSTVPGEISTTQVGSAVKVGQALSSTVLWVDVNKPSTLAFGQPLDYYIRSHGSSTVSNANAVQDGEAWNATSWSSITASTLSVSNQAMRGSSGYGGYHHVVGGNNSSTVIDNNQIFDRTSWTAGTARTTVAQDGAAQNFSGYLYTTRGVTANDYSSSATTYRWNSVSWASVSDTGLVVRRSLNSFVDNDLLSTIAGSDSVGADTSGMFNRNTSDSVSSGTSITIPGRGTSGGSRGSTAGGHVGNWATGDGYTSTSYIWNRTSWSTATSARTVNSFYRNCPVYMQNSNLVFTNGGTTSGDVMTATSETYNGTSFSSSTSSSTSRARATVSVIQ